MRFRAIPLLFVLVFPLPVSFQTEKASVLSSCNVTACWVESGPAVYTHLGGFPSIAISYVNYNVAASTGIVFAVLHDSRGQTVDYSTATLQLAAGSNGTAHEVLLGLAPGTYSATLFAVTPSGVAISTPTTMTFTILSATDTTKDWTLVNQPTILPIGCCGAGYAVYHNNLAQGVWGIPFMVLHNHIGQTVYMSSVSLYIPAGGDEPAYNVVSNSMGLSGAYNATFFAISQNGTTLSNVVTTFVTFPR